MAATKKNNTRKKTGTRSGSRNKKKQDEGIGLYTEIILWITLAGSILLLLSNFGMGGLVGKTVSGVFFGLFGLVAYIFPIFLFLAVSFVISNNRNPKAYRKMAGFLLLFLSACALMQLLTDGYFDGTSIMDYYKNSSAYHTGGGILGGLLCNIFGKAFGIIGTYVIVVIAMVIALILITQKSMFALLKKGSTRVYGSAKAGHARRKQYAAEQKDRPVSGRRAKHGEKTEESEPLKLKTRRNKKEDNAAANPAAENISDIKKEAAAAEAAVIEPAEEIPAEDILLKPENAFPIHRSDTAPAEVEEIVEEIPEEPAVEEKPHKTGSSKKTRSSKDEIADGIENIKDEIADKEQEIKKEYEIPPVSLLKKGSGGKGDSDTHLRSTAKKLQETLHNFGVNVTVTNVSCGPTVTRYELQPEQGVKVSKIVSLTDDIKLNLAATDIRIEAPIPGKAAVGIEVPNATNSAVMLRELIQSEAFSACGSKLAFAAGKDIAGQPVIADIAKMPHLLIAGATGSGKSVCINTLIMSILYKATPEEVRLIMIDPKVVELSVYNGIPHLLIPVVTDPKKAAGALNWAVAEMSDRYNKFAEYNVRDLKGYNAKVDKIKDIEEEGKPEKMPQIVIIVDELADLMMVAPGEVEDAICRLAQLARAAGIHLIIATQRPSVNVITGLIKANMPSRIAFSVSSGVDSRTIIDMNGAEKLLGKGDMLFYPQGYQKPARVQGAFVSDQEVGAVVKFLSEQNPAHAYSQEIQDKIEAAKDASVNQAGAASGGNDRDAYFTDAGKFIIEKDKASIGMLQRVFKIGFNRAARIMDQLCEAGVVGEEEGTKPRKVLMSMEEFEQYIEECL